MLQQILTAIVSFVIIDAIWIISVVMPTYKKKLPEILLLEKPLIIPAVIFYLLFNISLWLLVIKDHSGDLKTTLIKAFVFGVATYGTYSLTNLSVIKGWDSFIAVSDIVWGGILSVIVTYISVKFST